MNTDIILKHIIPDTSIHLSYEEKEIINTLSSDMIPQKKADRLTIQRLVSKGFIKVFNIGTEEILYQKDEKIITYLFYIDKSIEVKHNGYNINGEKTVSIVDRSNREKHLRTRRFLSQWINGTDRISEAKVSYYYFLYTKYIPGYISIPESLKQRMFEEVEKTNLTFVEITPVVKSIRCHVCGHITKTLLKVDTILCEKCRRTIYV